MFEKFTHKSQEAIINSQVIAQDNGQQHIEALHLLAAMLEQNEGLVKPVLEKLKIDPSIVEEKVWVEIEKLPKVSTGGGIVGMVQGTAEVAMILERAKKEAEKMGDEFVSTEHLLLAIIGVKSKTQNILLAAGVAYEAVLKILSELRGSQRITDPEPG